MNAGPAMIEVEDAPSNMSENSRDRSSIEAWSHYQQILNRYYITVVIKYSLSYHKSSSASKLTLYGCANRCQECCPVDEQIIRNMKTDSRTASIMQFYHGHCVQSIMYLHTFQNVLQAT